MKPPCFLRFALLFLVSMLSLVGQLHARVLYVNGAAQAGGDGQSWATAYQSLQDALAQTVEGDEVWVAAGTYYPDEGAAVTPGDRTITFTLKEGVAVYGGFDGTEASASQRDLEANPTILSGEIWEDSLYWSLHVVTLAGSASMDGLTITKGNANGDAAPFNQGGGVLAGNHPIELNNCTFSDNSASGDGGAIYSTSSLTARNCSFSGNSATSGNGGAIGGTIFSSSSVTASNCTFTDNSASFGGAIHSSYSSSVIASNCTFSGNSASEYGGAIYSDYGSTVTASNCTFSANSASEYGGAIYCSSRHTGFSSSRSCIVTASNCTFADNSASRGGAIYSSSSSSSSVTASNCTFSGNSASYVGGAMGASHSNVTASNCTFSGNSASYSGGAISFHSSSYDSVTASNCTFLGNSASSGGAISSSSHGTTSSVTMNNCTFTDNSATNNGGAIFSSSYASTSPVTAINCTFWNNSCETETGKGHVLFSNGLVKLFNNIIDDVYPSSGSARIYLSSTASLRNADSSFPSPLDQAKNFIRGGIASITAEEGAVLSLGDTSVLIMTGDPGFVDSTNPIGPDGTWGTADDGLRLAEGSIAIEQGLTRYLPQDTTDVDQDGDVDEIIPVDLAGYRRVQGTTVDLGAYESGGDAGLINLITAPASQTILSGQAAAFEVVAAGYSLNYQWYAGASGDTSTPIEGAAWKSWETGALTSSQSYWVRIYNGVTHLDSQTVNANINSVETYESWVAEHELSGSDAMDTATLAGDGVSNLMKYALGLDPREAAVSTDGTTPGKPAILESTDELTFTFFRNAEASDVSYTIEYCDDLSSWEPVLTGVTETVLSDALIKVEVPLPSGGSGFCRLVVNRQ